MIQIYQVDGTPKPEAPKKPEKPEPCATAEHCWHLSGEQHTIGNHSDWTCCNCGKRHCVRAPHALVGGHGPWVSEAEQKGCGTVLGKVVLP